MTKNHQLYKVSQWVMLVRDNKLLVLEHRPRPGMWELPGGRIEIGETDPEVAMRREVEEEIGINNFEIIEQVGWEAWHPLPKRNTITTVVLIKNDNDPITLSEEHSQFKWVTEDELDDVVFTWPGAREIIKKVFGKLK